MVQVVLRCLHLQVKTVLQAVQAVVVLPQIAALKVQAEQERLVKGLLAETEPHLVGVAAAVAAVALLVEMPLEIRLAMVAQVSPLQLVVLQHFMLAAVVVALTIATQQDRAVLVEGAQALVIIQAAAQAGLPILVVVAAAAAIRPHLAVAVVLVWLLFALLLQPPQLLAHQL